MRLKNSGFTCGLDGAEAVDLSTDLCIRSFVSADNLRLALLLGVQGDCEEPGVLPDEYDTASGILNVSVSEVEATSRNKGSVLNTEAEVSPRDVTQVSDRAVFLRRLPSPEVVLAVEDSSSENCIGSLESSVLEITEPHIGDKAPGKEKYIL